MGQVARELGLSRQAVRALHARGMPIDDAEAARQWRLKNLSPARRRPDAGPTPTARLDEVRRLGLLALAAIDVGRFAAIEPQLREALRAVPESHRARVELPAPVWDELTADVRAAIAGCAGAECSDSGEAFDADSFWFTAAAGLWRVSE